MLEKVLYWAAGFCDADGSFFIWTRLNHGRTYRSPMVAAANTKKASVELLYRMFGGDLRERKRRPDSGNAQDYWYWRVQGKAAIAVAALLAPRLVLKRRQAQLLTQWPFKKGGGWRGSETRQRDAEAGQQQESIEAEIRSLNRRGKE